ncbi:putative nucleotidyltransferase MAB21L1 [Styela clava]|uniref:putative nucleotidyltransferase MAB21L1 n=1 Tax=Styela clava TaxID=7725 RepID=UPI001939CA61|nr:putative nucleotidyltransferase MAB21L1 [Styela clava]
MLATQSKLAYHLNKYYTERTMSRKSMLASRVFEVGKTITDILKEVETQEPRFISTLNEVDGRLDGLDVISPTEFQVAFYLNQMGVFNFVDDGSIPGCAVLKLSDGRKRSMSLWVEFITASGYLSARKVRARFHTLVGQAIDRCNYRSCVKLMTDSTDVILLIRDVYTVRVIPAFKCTGIWPRSASHWPDPKVQWPMVNKVAEVKSNGFNLLSMQIPMSVERHSNAESDAWVMSFTHSEEVLISGGCRRRCLSILKTLRDRHLDFAGKSLNNYHMKTLVLYECEKHPREEEWIEVCIGDRLLGILIQFISCLQCRRFPHYFLPGVDLLAGSNPAILETAARTVWRLAREVITNGTNLDSL